MNKKIKRCLKQIGFLRLLSIPIIVCWLFPIKKNRIMLINFRGKSYGDSPKYVAECLKSDNRLELYWVVEKKNDETIPKEIEQVRLHSLRFFYIMATSRVWVANSRFDIYAIKRKGQFYIQTWHGGLALKKIEYDAEEKLDGYYKKLIQRDNKMIDLMVSNSSFCTGMYRRGFRYNGEILEVGTPRNDVLINREKGAYERVRKKCMLPKKQKIVLYAPTFRNNYDNNPYDIDLSLLLRQLKNNTNYEWAALVRFHPMAQKYSRTFMKYSDNIIDATNYPDTQDLISASDLVITDYSSVMFESLIAKKAVILYAKDMDKYADERGYYFRFDELPFGVAKSNQDLSILLKGFDHKKYRHKYEEFKRHVGLKENGEASKIVCERIIKECNLA